MLRLPLRGGNLQHQPTMSPNSAPRCEACGSCHYADEICDDMKKAAELRACIACKFYYRSGRGGPPQCERKSEYMTAPITGRNIRIGAEWCESERNGRTPDYCGPRGRFFRRKGDIPKNPSMIGRLLCRIGKHDLKTLRMNPSIFSGGMPSGALYECQRCGQIQEWVAAWDQSFCSRTWPSRDAYIDCQNVDVEAPNL